MTEGQAFNHMTEGQFFPAPVVLPHEKGAMASGMAEVCWEPVLYHVSGVSPRSETFSISIGSQIADIDDCLVHEWVLIDGGA